MPSPEPDASSAAPLSPSKNANALDNFKVKPAYEGVEPNTAADPGPPLDSGQSQKRRRHGPYIACDLCRLREVRCDGVPPVCDYCKTNGLRCTYLEHISALKKDPDILDYGRKFDQIQGQLEAVLGVHVNLDTKQKNMQSDLNKVVESLQRLTTDQERHRESLHWLTNNHQQTVSSSRLLHHFDAHGEVQLTTAERFKLEDLDEKLITLSHSPHWSTIRSRLVGYIASLPTAARKIEGPKHGFVQGTEGSQYQYLTGMDPCSWQSSNVIPPVNRGPHERSDPKESAPSPSESVMDTDYSLSRANSGASMASAYTSTKKRREMTGDWSKEKPHFCFHESCAQTYSAGKAFETHMRGHHKPRPPHLPGSCNHDGSVKTFATWEESLAHMMHHQKHLAMSRAQYDKILAEGMFFLDHDNMRIAPAGHGFDPDFNMLAGDGPDDSGAAWAVYNTPCLHEPAGNWEGTT